MSLFDCSALPILLRSFQPIFASSLNIGSPSLLLTLLADQVVVSSVELSTQQRFPCSIVSPLISERLRASNLRLPTSLLSLLEPSLSLPVVVTRIVESLSTAAGPARVLVEHYAGCGTVVEPRIVAHPDASRSHSDVTRSESRLLLLAVLVPAKV
jgi:hypothetical protein